MPRPESCLRPPESASVAQRNQSTHAKEIPRPPPRDAASRPGERPRFSKPNAISCHTLSHTSGYRDPGRQTPPYGQIPRPKGPPPDVRTPEPILPGTQLAQSAASPATAGWTCPNRYHPPIGQTRPAQYSGRHPPKRAWTNGDRKKTDLGKRAPGQVPTRELRSSRELRSACELRPAPGQARARGLRPARELHHRPRGAPCRPRKARRPCKAHRPRGAHRPCGALRRRVPSPPLPIPAWQSLMRISSSHIYGARRA